MQGLRRNRFTESSFPACFSFKGSISVGIRADDLQIDFKQISEEIAE
jgi:hypothetical protein